MVTMNWLQIMHKAQTTNPIAYAAFVKAMIGNNYGAEETHDAWIWFFAGWNAVHNEKAKR